MGQFDDPNVISIEGVIVKGSYMLIDYFRVFPSILGILTTIFIEVCSVKEKRHQAWQKVIGRKSI